jgi:predicted nucleotidyltransferase
MTDFEQQVLQRIKEVVKSIEPTAEVILFGSRSRGEANETSDFDFLILTEQEVTMSYEMHFQELIYDIELEMDTLIEAFLFSKHEWELGATPSPMIERIREEGVMV